MNANLVLVSQFLQLIIVLDIDIVGRTPTGTKLNDRQGPGRNVEAVAVAPEGRLAASTVWETARCDCG